MSVMLSVLTNTLEGSRTYFAHTFFPSQTQHYGVIFTVDPSKNKPLLRKPLKTLIRYPKRTLD